MKRFPLIFAALSVLISGCADHGLDPQDPADRTLVRASIEATDASRATLDRTTWCQLWRSGDRISIFDAAGGNSPFELQTGAGTTSATFRSDINLEESDTYYALYPYSDYSCVREGVIRTRYPDTLRYDAATGCATGGNLMAAKSNGTTFTFYNAATFIELQITGTEVLTGIKLTGNAGEAVAGEATIALTESGVTEVTMNEGGATSLFVDCGEGIALSETPAVVILAVAPVLKSGFTIEFTTDKQRVLTRRSSDPTVVNTVLQMPAFQCKGTSYATLVAGSTFNSRIKNLANGTTNATSSTDNTSITCVAFETGADLSGITDGVDVSAAGDGSILATFENGTVTVSTSLDSLKTGASGSYLFSRLEALTTLTHPERLITRESTTLRNMFHYCVALKTLDVSWINTDNATNLTSFFNHCEGLTAIDISSWNPAKVTDLSYLFNSCFKCTSITLGENFKNVKATSYYCLFFSCTALETLDEENLNLSSTTNINRLFSDCSSIVELDFSGTAAGLIAKADSAFRNCKKLERLNLSTFNTRNATRLRYFLVGSNALSNVTLGPDFALTASNRDDFFPALSSIDPASPSRWKLPLATAQALIAEYDNAAAALLAGKVVFLNAEGAAYLYKNAQDETVNPSGLSSVDEVKALTVCEP